MHQAEYKKVNNRFFLDAVALELRAGHSVKINVAGNSMRPVLKDRDSVLLVALPLENVRKGQIVFAKYQNAYVLHRVIKTGENSFLLAGDANLYQIEFVAKQDIIAVLTRKLNAPKQVNMNTIFKNWKGLAWFYIRPLRRVFIKILKII